MYQIHKIGINIMTGINLSVGTVYCQTKDTLTLYISVECSRSKALNRCNELSIDHTFSQQLRYLFFEPTVSLCRYGCSMELKTSPVDEVLFKPIPFCSFHGKTRNVEVFDNRLISITRFRNKSKQTLTHARTKSEEIYALNLRCSVLVF